ncbi:MAG: proline--tRNA ligase [Alphaproteobacteria bacterium CG1_02_46_17]|nr:MAG: proline--tRNA ligase [Alphaproteobacteria bacterium CG1_02_46_17]
MSQAQQAAKAAPQRTAITPTRAENFPEWYQSVVKAADMAENSPVRGAMVIKPYGYGIWEQIQRALDDKIKEEGVQNAYFPLLIPLSFISREADHVDGFAKECAVVTHHRLEKGPDGALIPSPDAKLEEPFVIRPTSETIIGDSMSKWVQSYRDLPLLLNQWCNVMRWEMRTRLFLRTSEFLWQEGHNAFETAEQAEADARKMLEVYRSLYVDFLAMSAFCGEKTADERFPGAVHTYTIESMMQDGKSLQAATSHNLGQNFAKSCQIKFQGRDGNEHFAHTTSWGLSTRSIGGLIMTHGDDDGLRMPPRIAPIQVMILPITKNDDGAAAVIEYAQKIAAQLKTIGVRVSIDLSDQRAPDKMWSAIKKGIPLRVEVGGREVEEGKLTHTCRDLGRESKTSCTVAELVGSVKSILDDIHGRMYQASHNFSRSRIVECQSSAAVKEYFETAQDIGFAKMPVELLQDEALNAYRKENALTTRCMPFEDEGRMVLVGKAY